MNLILKPPGTKRLKLTCDGPLSFFAFKFILRRYNAAPRPRLLRLPQGRAVQVDPIKPTLIAPGTKRLKVNCDTLLSTSAFKVYLRRYTKDTTRADSLEGLALEVPPAAYCSPRHGMPFNTPISVYRLGEMPTQTCGQSVSAPRGKAGDRLNAHTELRAKRLRSAREAIYRNRPIEYTRLQKCVTMTRQVIFTWL